MASERKNGGARVGAGRKKRDTEPIMIRLSPKYQNLLEVVQAEHGLARGDAVVLLLDRYFNS